MDMPAFLPPSVQFSAFFHSPSFRLLTYLPPDTYMYTCGSYSAMQVQRAPRPPSHWYTVVNGYSSGSEIKRKLFALWILKPSSHPPPSLFRLGYLSLSLSLAALEASLLSPQPSPLLQARANFLVLSRLVRFCLLFRIHTTRAFL